MARAKRTNRAEARRRYRETHPDAQDVIDETEPAADAVSLGRPSRSAPPARTGIMDTIRRSAGRPDIAGDIRALPHIALHSKALWLPLLIIAGTALLFFIPGLQRNPLVSVLGQIALTPPPMIMPFLGGMLAPRGAWLVGAIIGLANAVGFLVLVLVNTNTQVTPLGWEYTVSDNQKVGYIVNALTSAIPFGLLVGAFAGFYRRFLSASAPSRQPARQAARKR